MDQLTVMRRANGELFTLTVKGRKHLALWPSLESAQRYKYRNPGLLVFIPALVASPFGRKSLKPLKEDGIGLFLLVDAGGAHFSDGRKISWEDLEGSLISLSPDVAHQPGTSAPKQTPAGVAGQATANFNRVNPSDPLPALNRFADDGGNPNV